MERLITGLLIQIEQKVWQDLDTGLYVSHCDPLDVCSQGNTEEEAVKNLNEAIQIFLSSCYEMGTLNEVLMECGLTPSENGEEHLNGITEIDSPVVLTNQIRRKDDKSSDKDECPNLGFRTQQKPSDFSSHMVGKYTVRKDLT